ARPRRVLWLRRVLRCSPARGVDVDPRQEAGERRGDGCALSRRLRRRVSHADGGRAATTELADPRRASRRSPRGGRPMSELSTPFRERAANALGDRFLQQALTIATTKFIDLRREAFHAFPEREARRDRA